jgi:hypothetical protein
MSTPHLREVSLGVLNPFAHLERPIPEYLQLLSFSKKSELEKFCRSLEIDGRDFTVLISNAYKIGYAHEIKYNDFQPEHLQPTEEEVQGLGKTENGIISIDGQRFIRKISQLFKQRRYLVAHIFANAQRWHLFYFDQRDIQNVDSNHWKHGAHLHFVNDLWPNYDPNDVWALFNLADASVGGKLHIRYKPVEAEQEGSTVSP